MKNASWKTSAAGIAAIVAALATAVGALFDADPTTLPDWGAVAAAIIAGIGLIAARDNDVTSEKAGAV